MRTYGDCRRPQLCKGPIRSSGRSGSAGPLRAAAVLVGAQAVYEYVRDQAGDFAVPPFTLDADLALIPELLVDDPKSLTQWGAPATRPPPSRAYTGGMTAFRWTSWYRRQSVEVLEGERSSVCTAIVPRGRCAGLKERW